MLNLWALDVNGWANEYYSAAVRSMSESWNAFLFGTFDSSGVMTVDKPPMALWVQALSVRVFGFHPLAMLVPQALMGIATVALTYDLVRRRFGRRAGFVAGLVLALTPITVAISRHNNPDALLILCCVGALWALVRALEDGRTRWLVLAGALVGLGFETKMAVALMVVPGIVAAYLWVAPRGRLRAVRPAARRRRRDGRRGRLLARDRRAHARVGPALDLRHGRQLDLVADPRLQRPRPAHRPGRRAGRQRHGRWAGGGVFGGETGWLRLLDSSMGGQAGWFLGFALVAGAAVLAASRLRRGDPRTGWLIAVGGAFLTTAVAFSFAQGIFHPYYVSLLAPFTAALVGAGAAQLAAGDASPASLAPLAVVAGVLAEIKILGDNPGSLALAARRAARRRRRRDRRAGVPAAAGDRPGSRDRRAGDRPRRLVGADARPRHERHVPGRRPADRGHGRRPGGAGGGFAGGPPPQGGGGGMFGGDSSALSEALAYTRAHGGGTIAVSSQSGAGTQVIDGAEVAAIGGFSGNESEVTAQWLADAVRAGKVRWVLTSGDGRGGISDGRTGSRSVMAAVENTCNPVDSVSGLYDCQGEEAALAASAA